MDTPRTPVRVWVVLWAGLITLGASAIFIRLAGVDGAVDFRALVFWRLVFTVGLLVPVAVGREARADFASFRRRDVLLIGGAGLLLGVHFLGWFASLAYTSVASATVLVTMSPIFIAILGRVFLRERPSRRAWAAIVVGVVGAALIGLADARGGDFPQAALGNALAFGASVAIAGYLLIGRSARQRIGFGAYFVPLNVTVLALVYVVTVASGVSLAVSAETLGWCFVMALGPGLLGHGSLSYSVRYIPASTVGLLTLAEPIVSAMLAAGLFGEIPQPLSVVGMIVVLGSIAAVLWRPRR